jgi:hypothetical protein
MMTMALLAIVAAFVFGFVLCGMLAVGAAADLNDRPEEIGRLRRGPNEGAARRLESQRQLLSEFNRLQRRPRPRRRASLVRQSSREESSTDRSRQG